MVVVEIDCQALTNQARRHCVKNTANRDGAVTSDFDTEDFIVEIAMGWQLLQMGALAVDQGRFDELTESRSNDSLSSACCSLRLK